MVLVKTKKTELLFLALFLRLLKPGGRAAVIDRRRDLVNASGIKGYGTKPCH